MPTKIEWATESWNPITGCSPVSEGCQNCYARRMANRLSGRFGYPAEEPFRVTFHPDRLDQPLKWKKPRMIFVCSMGDLFHESVKFEWMQEIFYVAQMKAPQHIYLILTKRPEKMLDVLKETSGLPNVWLGISAENQPRFDERVSILSQTPAAKRFVSIEPMLGPVNLHLGDTQSDVVWRRTHGGSYQREFLDWVICGGESGPGARPMHPDWVRSVRDQCIEAGVPFFFKQWGEWIMFRESGLIKYPPTCKTVEVEQYSDLMQCKKITLCRVGKKTAGRLLDGREWDERP